MNTGTCLCQGIQFQVTAFEPLIGHCHCHMCQKFHGAAFSTFGEVKLSNLVWLQGKELLRHYQADNESVRSFCQQCGASLLFESTFNRENHTIEIALASFDELDDLTPDAHIYTESKASWCQISDQLPQYKAYRE